MDKNAIWARTNIPKAADLGDTELSAITSDASRNYRRVQIGAFSLLLFVYLMYLHDRVLSIAVDDPSFVHHLAVAMIFGATIGGLLGWVLQALVRRRIRTLIRSS